VSVVGVWMSTEHWWNDSDGGKNQSTLRKTVIVTLSTITFTWIDFELNLDLHSECWSSYCDCIHSPVQSRTAVIIYSLTVLTNIEFLCIQQVYFSFYLCVFVSWSFKKKLSIHASVMCLLCLLCMLCMFTLYPAMNLQRGEYRFSSTLYFNLSTRCSDSPMLQQTVMSTVGMISWRENWLVWKQTYPIATFSSKSGTLTALRLNMGHSSEE